MQNGRMRYSFGVIIRMFIHELPTLVKRVDGQDGDALVSTKLQKVFIECDWYEQVDVNPLTGLTIIEYNPYWTGSRIVLLEKCLSKSCVFWPSNPFTPANRKCKVFDLQIQPLDVIFHHETVES